MTIKNLTDFNLSKYAEGKITECAAKGGLDYVEVRDVERGMHGNKLYCRAPNSDNPSFIVLIPRHL